MARLIHKTMAQWLLSSALMLRFVRVRQLGNADMLCPSLSTMYSAWFFFGLKKRRGRLGYFCVLFGAPGFSPSVSSFVDRLARLFHRWRNTAVDLAYVSRIKETDSTLLKATTLIDTRPSSSPSLIYLLALRL